MASDLVSSQSPFGWLLRLDSQSLCDFLHYSPDFRCGKALIQISRLKQFISFLFWPIFQPIFKRERRIGNMPLTRNWKMGEQKVSRPIKR